MNKQKGEVMLVVIVLFMVISLVAVLGVVNPTVRNIKVPHDLLKSKQSLFVSDSGANDAIYRLKNNLNISSQEFLSLNGSFATTTIIDTVDGKKVTSAADYLDYDRTVEASLTKGSGVAFFYGVQVGQGGFTMTGNAQVNGNIYSNGTVSGGTVTGSAISAGPAGLITGSTVGQNGVGDAHAHTVNGSVVSGALKCKTGSANNKSCNTSFDDPLPLDMPITAEQISEWKAEAEAVSVISGDLTITSATSTGPVKITGNLLIRDKVTMTGTIWVEGTLSFSGTKAQIVMAPSTYSSNSGVIIVDKHTTFTGGSQILSTGQTGSYVMLLVTSDCPTSPSCSGNNAISASGGAGSVILAAPYGTISFSGNSNAKEVVAHKVIMGGSTTINYESGLANLNFVSGPSGGYYISDFKETE